MLNSLITIARHDLRLTLRQAHVWLTPLLFFVIVICLFPLALGPDASLLHRIAPAIVWIAALLATVISIGHLFKQDAKEGFLDVVLLSPQPITLFVFIKMVNHWLLHCLPLILICPVLGVLLHLDSHVTSVLMISLLLGTPVLSMLGTVGAALLVGVRHHGLLLPILIMPLYIPVLIFGTGAVMAASDHLPLSGYYAIMGAFILLSTAFAPLLAGTALRIGANQ